MKITIPDEYRTSAELIKVYISRWRDNSLLLMNQTGRDRLMARLDTLEDKNAQELVRIVKMGIFEAEAHNGVFELPEALEGWLGATNGVLKFNKGTFGLIISCEK